MSKTHTQCTLRRGNVEQTAWIPSEFAIKGKFVKLHDEDGWEVLGTGAAMDSAYVRRIRAKLVEGLASKLKEAILPALAAKEQADE